MRRWETEAANGAGVACAICTSVTRPTLLPARFASIRMDRSNVELPSGASPIMPLWVRTPLAIAVPAAAESVTRLFSEWVVAWPNTGSRSIANRPSRPACW